MTPPDKVKSNNRCPVCGGRIVCGISEVKASGCVQTPWACSSCKTSGVVSAAGKATGT